MNTAAEPTFKLVRSLSKVMDFDTVSQKCDFSLFFFSKQMKCASQNNDGNVGLLTYPVLQAADILLYK